MGADAFNPAIYGAQTNAMVVDHLKMVDITIYNWDAGKHPCKYFASIYIYLPTC